MVSLRRCVRETMDGYQLGSDRDRCASWGFLGLLAAAHRIGDVSPLSPSRFPLDEETVECVPRSPKEVQILRGIPRRAAHTSIHRLTLLDPPQVSRRFPDLVSTSHYLRHRIDLFSAGLVDNPCIVCSLTERRARLREYTDGWKDVECSVRCDYPLESRTALYSVPHGQDLFSAHSNDNTAISIFRLPSSLNRGTVKEWTLKIPFRFESHVVYPHEVSFRELSRYMEVGNLTLRSHTSPQSHGWFASRSAAPESHHTRLRALLQPSGNQLTDQRLQNCVLGRAFAFDDGWNR